jgi:hypothetical protein
VLAVTLLPLASLAHFAAFTSASCEPLLTSVRGWPSTSPLREEELVGCSWPSGKRNFHSGRTAQRMRMSTRGCDVSEDKGGHVHVNVTHRILEHAKEHFVGRRVLVRAYSSAELPNRIRTTASSNSLRVPSRAPDPP